MISFRSYKYPQAMAYDMSMVCGYFLRFVSSYPNICGSQRLIAGIKVIRRSVMIIHR